MRSVKCEVRNNLHFAFYTSYIKKAGENRPFVFSGLSRLRLFLLIEVKVIQYPKKLVYLHLISLNIINALGIEEINSLTTEIAKP